MKNEIEEIDKLIKETLNIEEAKFYDSLDEQNVLEMLFGLYKGKNAWINILINIMIIMFFGILIFSLIKFFESTETNELIMWGFGSIALFLNIAVLKLYAWMQMDKNALLREMKRLELLIISSPDKEN